MDNMIAGLTALSWGQLVCMASVFLTALLELRTREVKLWVLQILPSLLLALAWNDWWMCSTADIFSSFYHILGFIVVMMVYAIGIVIGKMIENEKPIVNMHNKTVAVMGSKRPLVLAVFCFGMIIIWQYCTELFPVMALCRLMLYFNLFFIAGLLQGRSNFYQASYARRLRSSQVFGN